MKTVKGIVAVEPKAAKAEKAKPELEMSLQIREGTNRFGKKYHSLDALLVDENGNEKWSAAKIFRDHIPAWKDALSEKNIATFRAFLKRLEEMPATPKK